jgi:hypothetical protein
MARIVNCVSTEEQAIFILKEHGFQLINDNSQCRCECGQTQAVVGYSEHHEQVALVGVCESCGDDDAWHEDVINK